MPSLRQIGTEAEDQAANHLLANGYTILARRYHAGRCEIDLIVLEQDLLVFIEVKYRKGNRYSALESITPRKMTHLKQAAEHYLIEHCLQEKNMRFDVITLTPRGIEHFKNAFS